MPAPPFLYGVSAFGTQLRYYKRDAHGFVGPPCRSWDVSQKCWDTDVLEKQGEKKFKHMAKEIRSVKSPAGV